jgi:hypothetical protein
MTRASTKPRAIHKRVAFGFRNFRHYRTRSLLYAGRPNWNLLASINP